MKIQHKITIVPRKKTIICAITPITTNTVLAITPNIREKILETKVLKNPPTSNVLGYCHLYLLQGEKSVEINKGTEKK